MFRSGLLANRFGLQQCKVEHIGLRDIPGQIGVLRRIAPLHPGHEPALTPRPSTELPLHQRVDPSKWMIRVDFRFLRFGRRFAEIAATAREPSDVQSIGVYWYNVGPQS